MRGRGEAGRLDGSTLARSALELRSTAPLSVHERTLFLVFTINVFQSLENEIVRSVALPLVSLPLWHALSPGRLQVRLSVSAPLPRP